MRAEGTVAPGFERVPEVFEAVLQAEASGEPAALVTVVSTEGSTPGGRLAIR